MADASEHHQAGAVEWLAYGPEAFRRAAELDRPILVDVGAVWCHWCHVMDRTTYEDAGVARLIAERFVAVRVDRDRMPAVDRRLQQEVAAYQHALTGQSSGGWPLTAFLTPRGTLIHGETYMPAERFLRVGEAVAEAYRTHKDRIDAREEALAQGIAGRRARGGPPTDIPDGTDRAVLEALRGEFDARHGGFGTAPKFPAPASIAFLIRTGREGRDGELLGMALKTLAAMAAGGMHDQVGGGFHRYSVDARWVVPHFEKMLDVNAGMLDNLLDLVRAIARDAGRSGGGGRGSGKEEDGRGSARMNADQEGLAGGGGQEEQETTRARGDAEARGEGEAEVAASSPPSPEPHVMPSAIANAATDTIRWLDEVMSDRERGGFFGSQDADVGLDDDGRYFTWSAKDFRGAVPADAADLAAEYFGVTEAGQMEEVVAGERQPTGQNVLRATTTVEALAAKRGVSVEAVRSAIERALGALRVARGRRTAPAVDRTILVDWNAATVRAYLKAAVVLGREDCGAFALLTIRRLLSQAREPNRGMAHVITPEGVAQGYGHLADNAWFAAALLDAYALVGERHYLEAARGVMDFVMERLWDAERGGFYDAELPADALGLFRRPQKDVQDQGLPSSNAVAAETLVRLAQVTGAADYRECAQQTLAALGGLVAQLGSFGAGLATALEWLTRPPAHLVVVGPLENEVTRRLHAAALRADHPRLVVQLIDPKFDGDLLQALGHAALDRPMILVCGRSFCLAPVTEPGQLAERLAELVRESQGRDMV